MLSSTRDRSTLFNARQINQQQGIYWSLDYTPRIMGILQIVRKHWHIISDIPGCESFPTARYKRTCLLREILVSADRPQRCEPPTNLMSGHFQSGLCSVWFISIICKEINFPDLGFIHKIQQFSNCRSRLCVYLLTCPCGLRYVGSTRCQLKVRIRIIES